MSDGMDADALTDRTQQLYNEETGNELTDARVLSFLNVRKTEVEKDTLCYPYTETSSITSGQGWIALHGTVFSIRSVQTTVYVPLPGPYSLAEMQQLGINWKTNTGVVNRWFPYYSIQVISTVPKWVIGLYPIPDATVSSGITIFGFATSLNWSTGSEYPAWPNTYHEVLAWGACVEAAIRDMERGTPVPEHAMRYFMREYQRRKDELKAAMATFLGAKTYQRGAANRISDEAEVPLAVVMIE